VKDFHLLPKDIYFVKVMLLLSDNCIGCSMKVRWGARGIKGMSLFTDIW
jgi:hypothetical protein